MSRSESWTQYVVATRRTARAEHKLPHSVNNVWYFLAFSAIKAKGKNFGRCRLRGLEPLVSLTGYSERTVRRAIDELVSAGFLRVEGDPKGPCQYILLMPTPAAAPAEEGGA
jgi:hypothetical protein